MASLHNLASVQAKVSAKHPELTVLSYTNARSPMLIRCPVHGEVSVPYAASVVSSGQGCPECGRKRRGKHLKEIDNQLKSPEIRAKGRQASQDNDLLRKQGLYPPRRIQLTQDEFDQMNQRRAEKGLPELSPPAYLKVSGTKGTAQPTVTKKQQLLELKRLERERLELEILDKLESTATL